MSDREGHEQGHCTEGINGAVFAITSGVYLCLLYECVLHIFSLFLIFYPIIFFIFDSSMYFIFVFHYVPYFHYRNNLVWACVCVVGGLVALYVEAHLDVSLCDGLHKQRERQHCKLAADKSGDLLCFSKKALIKYLLTRHLLFTHLYQREPPFHQTCIYTVYIM